MDRAIRPQALATAVRTVVERVLGEGESFAREIRTRGETYRILGDPLKSIAGSTLAARIWVDESRVERTRTTEFEAFLWDSKHWVLVTDGTGGAVLPTGHEVLHGAWFLARIVECEERTGLLTALLEPRPDLVWEGCMRVRTVDGKGTTRVFGHLRYHTPDWLCVYLVQAGEDRCPGEEDLSDEDRPVELLSPTYHYEAAAALLGGTAALIDLQSLQIIEWLTPPLSQIAWRHHPESGDTAYAAAQPMENLQTTTVVHPDDFDAYVRTTREFMNSSDASVRCGFRLRTVDGTWCPVELYLTHFPNGPRRFAIALIGLAALPISPAHHATLPTAAPLALLDNPDQADPAGTGLLR